MPIKCIAVVVWIRVPIDIGVLFRLDIYMWAMTKYTKTAD